MGELTWMGSMQGSEVLSREKLYGCIASSRFSRAAKIQIFCSIFFNLEILVFGISKTIFPDVHLLLKATEKTFAGLCVAVEKLWSSDFRAIHLV